MSAGEYFIYVKKENNSFTVVDEKVEESIKNDNMSPSEGISSKNNVIFKVGVTVLSSSSSNNYTFPVGDKYYKLNLETNPTTSNIINNSKSFKDAVPEGATTDSTPAATGEGAANGKGATTDSTPAATGEGAANGEGATTGEGASGGQKQKQQKSKRNYSKKRRSSKSKSDTLRNYFNYDHLQ